MSEMRIHAAGDFRVRACVRDLPSRLFILTYTFFYAPDHGEKKNLPKWRFLETEINLLPMDGKNGHSLAIRPHVKRTRKTVEKLGKLENSNTRTQVTPE